MPANFSNQQCQAIKDAATLAGLSVLHMPTEPTAAAIACSINTEKDIILIDLGGGKCAASLVNVVGGKVQVKYTCGDDSLGGGDFDKRLVEYCAQELKYAFSFLALLLKENRGKQGKDISKDRRAMSRLLTACERAKRTLSSSAQTTIEIDDLQPGVDHVTTITRAKFEAMCGDLFHCCLKPVEQVLQSSSLKASQIDEVILVGGSTRIPKIQQLLQTLFGKELKKCNNPEDLVVIGAAMQAVIMILPPTLY